MPNFPSLSSLQSQFNQGLGHIDDLFSSGQQQQHNPYMQQPQQPLNSNPQTSPIFPEHLEALQMEFLQKVQTKHPFLPEVSAITTTKQYTEFAKASANTLALKTQQLVQDHGFEPMKPPRDPGSMSWHNALVMRSVEYAHVAKQAEQQIASLKQTHPNMPPYPHQPNSPNYDVCAALTHYKSYAEYDQISKKVETLYNTHPELQKLKPAPTDNINVKSQTNLQQQDYRHGQQQAQTKIAELKQTYPQMSAYQFAENHPQYDVCEALSHYMSRPG